MSNQKRRIGTIALSVVVVVALVFSVYSAWAPSSGRPSTSAGTPVVSGGARELSRPAATCGQSPVALGSAATYAALSGTTVTSTGATALTGDIGVSPGSAVTGFPPGTYTGTKNVANPAAASAEADLTTAYNDAAGRSNCAITVAGNIGGQTLSPGLYKSTSSLAISSGDLTLNGGGNPNAVFVFQVASALTTTSGRAVVLSNGAQAGNVFWQMGSSATLGTTSTMQGTILTYASITMTAGAHLNGRALARTGDVTMSASTIVVPTTTTSSTYTVTFTATGLTMGTPWSVTMDGVSTNSSSGTVGFTVANGTYPFTVGTSSGYTTSPSSGSITVTGTPAGKTIAFNSTGSGGGGGGSSSPGGIPVWGWALIAIAVIGAVAAAGAIALRRRGKAT
jgi:ice-binding like protein